MNTLAAGDYVYIGDLIDQVPACMLAQLRQGAYLSGDANEPILEVERIAELVEACQWPPPCTKANRGSVLIQAWRDATL
jgi:hypothetical protein